MNQVLRQAAPGIYQIQLPLPFALRIVNCYLLQDGDRWVIVDSGLNLPAAREIWLKVFSELKIEPGQLDRIILTHYHPDHYGLAGWLQEWCRQQTGIAPPVYMSAREAEQAREIFRSNGNQVQLLADFFRRCGMPEDLTRELTTDILKLHGLIRPQPEALLEIRPGETLRVGEYEFSVLLTPGHSDGHLIFWDRDKRLALCGDHVLLKITPNISQWPTTEPDPLGRYLASLDRLEELPVATALPGHGPDIREWHQRLEELRLHHDERLQHMFDAVRDSASVFDVCQQVFDLPSLSYHEIRFAIAETRAHLELLVRRGALGFSENGMWRYWKS